MLMRPQKPESLKSEGGDVDARKVRDETKRRGQAEGRRTIVQRIGRAETERLTAPMLDAATVKRWASASKGVR